MKLHRIISILFLLVISKDLLADSFFKIQSSNESTSRIWQNTVYTSNSTIPFKEKGTCSGLSISGNIEKQNEDYLVRVILKAEGGHKYCVLESYEEIHDSSFAFSDYCEETSILDSVVPDSLVIIVYNAVLTLDCILLSNAKNDSYSIPNAYKNEIRLGQLNNIIDRINAYNISHNKLWSADLTPLALKCYEDKMKLLDLKDNESTNGIDYYADGIFESGNIDSSINRSISTNSDFIDQFDWRNRHGKNWLTPIRNQGRSFFCYSFCAIGCVEAMVNLHYNRKLDLHLSEDEGARCSYEDDRYSLGGSAPVVLDYIKSNGICDEASYPFIDQCCISCRREQVEPNEVVMIDNYSEVDRSVIDSVKSSLINRGPLTSGYLGHAMTLVGYGTLKEGDVITVLYTRNHIERNIVIEEGDDRIGMTYWIFKNSFGTNAIGNIEGYWYILFNNFGYMRKPYYITKAYATINYSEEDIVCEDADGDGLYFWGLGPKPSNCPSWVPDIRDGDDSDINYGEMDMYGYLQELPTGITIKTDTICYESHLESKRIGIVNDGVLTITGNITMTSPSIIRVCEGGELVVDGGNIGNADIQIVPGGTLTVKNNGVISMASGKSLEVPIGAVLNLENGVIE